jgi:hypothetical protein
MTDPSPLPTAVPFNRLAISDGLLMTADLWNQAHDYHRQRQHFYYQALFQPGIVWGLGVSVVAAPRTIEERYRDRRWLQVQPGVAIDRLGHPIVVPEAINFRVQSDPTGEERPTVFLVVRYSDPRDRVGNGSPSAETETFALVETTDPQPEDVELCRLVLTAGQPDLTPPQEVLAPGPNQPDLRYRPRAHLRPQGQVQLVAVGQEARAAIAALAAAVPTLYPTLAPLPPVTIASENLAAADPSGWDWVYLSDTAARSLGSSALDILYTHLAQGGGVVVGLDMEKTALKTLYSLATELQAAIATARREEAAAELQTSLQEELVAVQGKIAALVDRHLQTLQDFGAAVGCPLQGSGEPGAEHPLRQHPFRFSGWPQVAEQPLSVRTWGGLVAVVGPIAAGWAAPPDLNLPREQVRGLQELGINLIHDGWHRRHLHRLQSGPSGSLGSSPAAKGLDSLRERRPEGGV